MGLGGVGEEGSVREKEKNTSWESNGFIPDFMSMFAKTKYFKQVVLLGLPDSS